jgi:hypothetical protein
LAGSDGTLSWPACRRSTLSRLSMRKRVRCRRRGAGSAAEGLSQTKPTPQGSTRRKQGESACKALRRPRTRYTVCTPPVICPRALPVGTVAGGGGRVVQVSAWCKVEGKRMGVSTQGVWVGGAGSQRRPRHVEQGAGRRRLQQAGRRTRWSSSGSQRCWQGGGGSQAAPGTRQFTASEPATKARLDEANVLLQRGGAGGWGWGVGGAMCTSSVSRTYGEEGEEGGEGGGSTVTRHVQADSGGVGVGWRILAGSSPRELGRSLPGWHRHGSQVAASQQFQAAGSTAAAVRRSSSGGLPTHAMAAPSAAAPPLGGR